MTARLTLGYRAAVAATDSVLAAAGTRVRGHEFHRTVADAARPAPAGLAVVGRRRRGVRRRAACTPPTCTCTGPASPGLASGSSPPAAPPGAGMTATTDADLTHHGDLDASPGWSTSR